MEEFIKNTGQVIDFLIQKNASYSIVSAAKRCFQQFRTYLEDSGISYSKAAADKWVEQSSAKYARHYFSMYRQALLKLDDIYTYGEIHHTTHFKSDGTHYDNLTDTLRCQLENFLSDLQLQGMSAATVQNYRNGLSRILHDLHSWYGINDICLITYEDIICFYNDFRPESYASKTQSNSFISKLLCYFHQEGALPYGYTILIHYLKMGKGTFWNITDKTNMNKIRMFQAGDKRTFSLEEFLTAREKIYEIHTKEKYSRTARTSYFKWLGALYLFLEMNGLVYCPEISWMWLEQVSPSIETEYLIARRALCLMEQRFMDGKSDVTVTFRKKPNVISHIPGWCVPEVTRFLHMKESEGWAYSTICMYRSSICRFCIFLGASEIGSFEEITAGDIKEFNRTDSHKTPAGKNAYNVRIRKFLFYLGEIGKLRNPMLFVALPSVSAPKETIVVILTKEELNTLQNVLREDHSQLSLRNKAILQLGLRMGIRSSDIVDLLLDDIDWHNTTLRFIQNKTNVEVHLPIPTDVANALYRYLMLERPETECRNVFIREKAPYSGIKRQACLLALEKALPERDVPGSGFHVTRKTYASSLLSGGVGINTVAEALGQVGTKSVHRYLSLDEERMRLCSLTLKETNLSMEGDFQ